MSKLMSKKEALAAMSVGMCVRHLTWDTPYHNGCSYCYIKEGEIWNANTMGIEDAKWLSFEEFKNNGHLETGWYIYEDSK